MEGKTLKAFIPERYCQDFFTIKGVVSLFERAICDSEALYEKESLSLLGLTLVCDIVHSYIKDKKRIDDLDLIRARSFIRHHIGYVRDFRYECEGEGR